MAIVNEGAVEDANLSSITAEKTAAVSNDRCSADIFPFWQPATARPITSEKIDKRNSFIRSSKISGEGVNRQFPFLFADDFYSRSRVSLVRRSTEWLAYLLIQRS